MQYLFSLLLVVEAESVEEADDIVSKIVNADFSKEVDDKIVKFAYEFEVDFDD